jgi:hypothetical protein
VHAPLVQAGTALAGALHIAHALPHARIDVSLTHEPLQAWKPGSHAIVQTPATHVTLPFDGVAHGVHVAPHARIEVSLAHTPPQSWKPPLHA